MEKHTPANIELGRDNPRSKRGVAAVPTAGKGIALDERGFIPQGAGMGMYLLAVETLLADAGNINFSNIAGNFRDLCVHLEGQIAGNGAAATAIRMRLNGSSAASYDGGYDEIQAAAYIGAEYAAATSFVATGEVYGTGNTAAARVCGELVLHDYKGVHYKMLRGSYFGDFSGGGTGAGGRRHGVVGGMWKVVDPVSSIDLFPATGNFKTGFTASLYAFA